MNHSQEIFYMVFVSDNQPPKVLKPGKQALDLPSAPVTSQFPAVLGKRFFSVPYGAVRSFQHLVHSEADLKFIAIVRLITNQLIRCMPSKAAVYRGLDKLYFMGRSAFNVSGDRKTSSVCDCHDLGAFREPTKTSFWLSSSLFTISRPIPELPPTTKIFFFP